MSKHIHNNALNRKTFFFIKYTNNRMYISTPYGQCILFEKDGTYKRGYANRVPHSITISGKELPKFVSDTFKTPQTWISSKTVARKNKWTRKYALWKLNCAVENGFLKRESVLNAMGSGPASKYVYRCPYLIMPARIPPLPRTTKLASLREHAQHITGAFADVKCQTLNLWCPRRLHTSLMWKIDENRIGCVITCPMIHTTRQYRDHSSRVAEYLKEKIDAFDKIKEDLLSDIFVKCDSEIARSPSLPWAACSACAVICTSDCTHVCAVGNFDIWSSNDGVYECISKCVPPDAKVLPDRSVPLRGGVFRAQNFIGGAVLKQSACIPRVVTLSNDVDVTAVSSPIPLMGGEKCHSSDEFTHCVFESAKSSMQPFDEELWDNVTSLAVIRH